MLLYSFVTYMNTAYIGQLQTLVFPLSITVVLISSFTIGLMLGIACSIKPIDVVNKCMDLGLLLVKAGHDVVRFVPPLIIDKTHVYSAIEILDNVLKTFQT